MPPDPPIRLLFLRPDTYGDLFLFEPVLRLVRHAWPMTEVGVLIRKPYEDAVPLFLADGVRWLTTTCHPYRDGPGEDPAARADLREVVQAFAPDCIVAACAVQTWLESAVAAFLPGTRQVSLGPGLTDPILRAALDAVMPVDWSAIYPEKISVETESVEWEKNLRLVSALTGRKTPRWWPVAQVPEAAKGSAARILAGAGLSAGEFVVCPAAGTANVQIKSWPAEHYGVTLAWLERERGIRALLIGHVSERDHLETVRQAARRSGANPALWVGQDGEMPVVAGLLEAARFYLGNDTGALHLAAALGRPVVSIFGGGTWPRFQPVARRSLTLVQPLPCFGCAWECYFVDAPCVRTISPASVRQAVEQFLRDDAEGQTIFEAEGLDAGARALIHTATPHLRFVREDRAARGKQITEMTAWLSASEAERIARGKQLDTASSKVTMPLPPEDEGAKELPAEVKSHGFNGTEIDRRRNTNATKPGSTPRDEREIGNDVERATVADLQLKLRGSEAQELANRAEARRLGRELSLAHRLLKFSFGDPPPDLRPRPALVTGGSTKFPGLRAALTKGKVLFHIDACERQGTSLAVCGWAFRRVSAWDARETTVTLLFRHGPTVYSLPTRRILRPDVAAHFADQPNGVSGGARGLERAGFVGEVPCDSWSAPDGLEMVLRLEHAGRACEQPTGLRVWL